MKQTVNNTNFSESEEYEMNLRFKYAEIWDKKYRDKGQAIWAFQRRTLSSACVITVKVKDLDFGAASTYMFHLANKSGECRPIIEAVNSQIEYAMVNPDKFIKGLHKFFQELTKPIKRDKKYALYFKSLAYVQECAHNGLIIDGKVEHNKAIELAAVDMLLQGTEYLKKQDFDITNIVVGISTEDEPIIIRDLYPLVDIPGYYFEALLLGRGYDKNDRKIPMEKRMEMLPIYYERFGYKGITDADLSRQLTTASQLYNNTVLSMATIMNEYLVDMLPANPLVQNTPYQAQWWPELRTVMHSTEFYKDALHHRRRTLPTNGAVIQLSFHQMVREVKLKETCRDNEIICVYKIVTAAGDLSGYYNTNTEWFYSMLDDSNNMKVMGQIQNLVLWLYTALVCDLPDVLPTDASFRRFFDTYEGAPTDVRFLALGGKPRNYLKKDAEDDGELRVFDKSKYDASSKNINGFIRKLPVGHKASERSVRIAESYGFELHEDETFVTPFVRRQWLRKKTDE